MAVVDNLPSSEAALSDCTVLTGGGTVANTTRVQARQSVVVIGSGSINLS